MSVVPDIPPALMRVQIAASDPAASAWVSANAGSGKTHVLTQRVIRLLLDGVDPAKILCLTFTKAAAANMATRVFDTLAGWTALDNAALDAEIAKIEGSRPSAARRVCARRLFAEALETPGGLKVQTIHAFCTALLHQFPFEADVAARFEVLEERAEAELVDRLRLQILQDASTARESPLGRALTTAIIAAADTTFANVVREAIAERDAVEAWIKRAGSVAAAVEELSRTLDIAPNDSVEQVEAEFLGGSVLPASEWPAISAALAQGSKTDREHVARLARAQAGNEWTNVEAYLEIFCTAELEPRQNVVTSKIKNSHPDLFERLMAEQARVCGLLERRRAIRARDRTAALITIADAVIRRCRNHKEQRGLLDYDDLIDKALALLSGEGSAAWVMYKLDLGIDHVLIDEAQDTSPKQWEVIRRLTAEFTAGAGARGYTKRSIFAVGDEKQSIYSFQGAAPHRFDEMRRHFAREHEASGLDFESIPFRASFRSAPIVLDAVDTVFRRPEAYSGLTADPVPTVHEAVRATAPGCVEIWDVETPDEKAEIEAWDAPFDTVSEHSPQLKLARRIAAMVRGCIGRGMRAGDVLILVRQRGALFESIIRELKTANVDVAGADRLVLGEHIAVMDLMSLADALLLPEDDLALAEVLKSPLFGLDDDRLFELAWQRKGTLRAALRAKTADDPLFGTAAETLDTLAAAARRDTPFTFYAQLLGPCGGRRKILARLGLEAADALDEFLALALDYERRNTPSLQGFVAWLRATQSEVKRDMDIVREEVRVMTVHGAKGLEAPLVILADTITPPAGPRDPRLLQLEAAGIGNDAGPPLVWAVGKKQDVAAIAKARDLARRAAEEEHRRLLYVAMTRAADRLIICGAQGVRGRPPGCWYELVADALMPDAVEVTDAGGGKVWRWQKSDPDILPQSEPAEPIEGLPDVPDWLHRELPASPKRTIPLTPSSAEEEYAVPWRAFDAPESTDAVPAIVRGRLTHRLLQSLPDVPPEHRAETARRFLARARPKLSDEGADTITAEVVRILDDSAFARLFAPGSRAEVPIVGRVADRNGVLVPVSGQVDRLAVTTDAVLVGDYKTDRSPPRRLQDVPELYRRQLALYRVVLGRLYPGRTIRAALIWTQTPELMELPATLLDAALSHLDVSAA